MNSKEIALEYKVGTRVKVLCEESDLYGEYAWVQRVSENYVLVKNTGGVTEWVDATGEGIKKAKDQVPPS